MAMITGGIVFEDSKSMLEDFVEKIIGLFAEYEETRYPKAVIYTKKTDSVHFTLPGLINGQEIEFIKADKFNFWQADSAWSYENKLIVYVPFNVESLGNNEFIARNY